MDGMQVKNSWPFKYLPWIAVPVVGVVYYSLLLVMSMTTDGASGFSWLAALLISLRLSLLWILAQKWLTTRISSGKAINLLTFIIGALGIMVLNVAIYYLLRSILIPIFAPEYTIFEPTIFLLNFLEGFLQGIMLMSILYAINLFKQWQKEAMENARLKANELELHNKVLKSQLNPHFLFNNLNTLSSLIKSEPKTADLFLHEMSDIYRYILRTSDDELVELSAEMKFAESYNHILAKRYGNNYKVSVDITDLDYYIPPMSLHSLLENIVKHNRIDDAYPMVFSITQENDSLVIENKIQLKNNVDSLGQGMLILKRQFKYLTEREVIIEETADKFKVILPLLKL